MARTVAAELLEAGERELDLGRSIREASGRFNDGTKLLADRSSFGDCLRSAQHRP